MYFKEREDFIMNTKIKTLKGWNEFAEQTGKYSWSDYAKVGDIVDETVVDYFLNVMPPRAMSSNYLQMGEPFSHRYDIDRRLRATYMTFARSNNVWRYYGHCFSYETINRD